jgi:hypothetical protein
VQKGLVLWSGEVQVAEWGIVAAPGSRSLQLVGRGLMPACKLWHPGISGERHVEKLSIMRSGCVELAPRAAATTAVFAVIPGHLQGPEVAWITQWSLLLWLLSLMQRQQQISVEAAPQLSGAMSGSQGACRRCYVAHL